MQAKTFYGIPLISLPPEVSRILIVSNLDSSMNGEMLYKIFGSIGAIRQIRVSNSAETANTAFIIYEDVFNAKTAQERFNGFIPPSKNKNLAKRPLSVKFFNEKRHQQAAEAKKKRKQQLDELGRRQREMEAIQMGNNSLNFGESADKTAEVVEGPKIPQNSAYSAL